MTPKQQLDARKIASDVLLNFFPDFRAIDPAIRRTYGDKITDAVPAELEKLRLLLVEIRATGVLPVFAGDTPTDNVTPILAARR